jgi:hypothetical protein
MYIVLVLAKQSVCDGGGACLFSSKEMLQAPYQDSQTGIPCNVCSFEVGPTTENRK